MSDDGDGDGRPGRREVAVRAFAAEYDDATLSYSESDEERAPNYVVTPTGARVNRLFVVGVLTELERVNDEVLRARVVDPTGAFVVYAGQYQPDALAFLERVEPPAFVAVTGKARTFEPDDGDRIYTSIRPERISEVDADTRDRWVVRTAEHTLNRVATTADAVARPERGDDLRAVLRDAGVDPSLAAGVPRALDHYGTTTAYLAAVRDLALDAVRVVAGERDETDPLSLTPGDGGDVDLDVPEAESAVSAVGADATVVAETTGGTESEPAADAEPSDVTRAETETDERSTLGDPVGSESSAGQPAAPEPAGEPGETVETEAADTDEFAEPAAENAEAPAGENDEVTADADAIESTAADEGDDDATDEMYEFDDDERQEIEENFDMEFSTGSDIPDAGESDIETPEPDAGAGESAGADAEEGPDAAESDETALTAATDDEEPDMDLEQEPETEPETVEEFTEEEYEEADEAPGENVAYDLEDVVVDAMRSVGSGEGADRDAVVREVVEEYDVTEGEVEDAIQSALMSGRCYESGDDELTPI